jgi:hypothetical protein
MTNDPWWNNKNELCNTVVEQYDSNTYQCYKVEGDNLKGETCKKTETMCSSTGLEQLNNFKGWGELGKVQPTVKCKDDFFYSNEYSDMSDSEKKMVENSRSNTCGTNANCNFCCGVTVGGKLYGPHCRDGQCGTGHFASSMIDMNIDPTNNWAKCQSK